MLKNKRATILFIVFFSSLLCLPLIALAEISGIQGSVFPDTCAGKMADVPKKDAYSDTSEPGKKSYATSTWYKDAVATWKSSNLTAIHIGPATKDILGESIFVNKKATAAFSAFSKSLDNCPEIKNSTYKIVVYDHFACRLMTGETKLSYHAEGFAIDINVPDNKYFPGTCVPGKCNYPPCVLKAAKDSGVSWGGGLPSSPLYPGICDGHHFEYRGGVSNIQEADLIFCQKDTNPDACASDKDCPKDKPLCSLAEFKCTAGAPCATSLDCNPTEFCDNTISQCLPQLPSGKPCDDADQCISGECANNQCACAQNADCEKNQFCDVTKNNCVNKVAAGETCPADPKNCISGVCEEKTIVPQPAQQTCVCTQNDHCPADKYCAAGASLDAGLCLGKLDEGAACSATNGDAVCKSGKCAVQLPEMAGTCTAPPIAPAATTTTTPAPPPEPVKYTTIAPKINVPIPGLAEFQTEEITAGDTVSIPWLAQYIVAVYKYMITIGAAIAVIMLMVGGLQYMIGGAYAEAASGAKKMMLGAVGGLVVLLSANLILQMINPKLVNLQSLSLKTVEQSNMEDVAMELYGSFDLNASGATVGPILPGKYRSTMLSSETCGDKAGMSLPTVAERLQRLVKIVNVWKVVAAEQGGAIYVRGGETGCTDKSFSQEEYQLLSLTNLYNAYPATFAAYQSTACLNVVDALSKMPKKPRPTTDTVSDFMKKYGAPSKSCLPMINALVVNNVVKPAQAAGMMCGDCGTFQEHLYSECFDKKIGGRAKAGLGCKLGAKGLNKFRFKIDASSTPADLQKALAALQFGDIIHMVSPGHYFMYTGKVPGLGFEILEMGSGGSQGDIANNSYGAMKAVKNIGLDKLDASGVRAYNSAEKYLQGLLNKGTTFCGYSVVDDSFYSK